MSCKHLPLHRARGFTLIELMVAIGLMAVMVTMCWRGLDGITRAQKQMQERSAQVLTLQAGLNQWESDLNATATQPDAQNLEWDGRVLRILRHNTSAPRDGLIVVAWSQRMVDGVGYWARWQSPPLRTRSALQMAWHKASIWAQNPGDDERKREVLIVPMTQWQLFYYRGNAWSNPMSSSAGEGSVPQAIRLVLTLSPGQAIHGTLTRDWLQAVSAIEK